MAQMEMMALEVRVEVAPKSNIGLRRMKSSRRRLTSRWVTPFPLQDQSRANHRELQSLRSTQTYLICSEIEGWLSKSCQVGSS